MASSSSSALGLLVSCAHAIQDGNLKLADSLLEMIWNLAAKESHEVRRKVVECFAEALVRRAYGLHPTASYSNFQITPPLHYYFDGWLGTEEPVRDVISNTVMGKKRFHLIDFQIPNLYSDAGYLFATLPSRSGDPLSVRVSVILSPVLENTVNVLKETQFLTRNATLFEVELKELKVIYANSLGDVDASMLDFRRAEDEAVVVYYNFKLHRLLAEAKSMEREMIKLRQINPNIMIILEHYANINDSNFIRRLEVSFQHYSSFFDEAYFGGYKDYMLQIHNIVACEGRDRILRYQTLAEWQGLLLTSGFLQVPIQLEKYVCDRWETQEEKGCLVYYDEDRPISFLSAWNLKVGEEHSNFNPMSHKFGQGFSPSPLLDNIIQPFQPFPEGWTLNRFAAFAEIYDMLEDVCSKYELPLAITWAIQANGNEIMSDPFKKRTFFIQNTFGEDCSPYDFCEEYIRTQEVQAFVEKALQSNYKFHFEPSVATHREHDIIFAAVACRLGDHAVVSICLENRYIINDVYVVQFFWPATESEKSESLASDIFNDLKILEKKFVKLRVQGTKVGFQEEANVQALEKQGLNEQGGVVPNFRLSTPMRTSPPGGVAAFNTPNLLGYNKVLQTQELHEQKEIGEKNPILPQTKQRKLSSKVWEDFDRIEVTGKQVAKCKHCHKAFTGSSKSGTTHLKNHSERCPSKKKKIQEGQLSTFPVEKSHLTTQDTNERSSRFDQERSRLDFTKMIVKHQFPLDLAEREFFKTFVKNLQPLFEFQSQAIILSDIHRIYDEEKKKLQQYFNQLACNFSLTISLWKDDLRKIAYCCLTAHFIDDDWELKMKILAFKTLEHIYDIEALSGIIRGLLTEWDLGKRVCSITVDNSFLNDDMVRKIKENCLSDPSFLPSSHWFVSCTLIEDGFREMDDILLKLRKSIEYANETTNGKLKFQEAVNQVKLQGGKSMDDLSLRLDSSFGILDSALESREIFCQLEQIDGNFKVNLSMEEWEKALALHSFLKDYDDILNSFKGTQSLAANLYFPKLCNIYRKFLQLEKSNYPFITLMKRKFDHYWSICNLVFAVAAALDPRLKFEFVEFSYDKIYRHDSEMHLIGFRKVFMNFYHEYANESRNLNTSASIVGDLSCSTTQIADDCILDSFSKFASARRVNEVVSQKSELDCYLGEGLLPLDGAFFDILGWWRVHSERFPTLGKMARDLLAIPVSIFPPCPDFSAMITNPAYRSLNSESMEALVCSQNWLEIPKGSDNKASHEPVQNTSKSKKKMDEKETCVVKIFKNWNTEEANSTGGKARDSNKNAGIPSFDNWLVSQCSSSESVGEQTESMEASVCNQNRLEMSKENDKANHAPMLNSGKRKLEENDTHAAKSYKNWYCGETSSGDQSKATYNMSVHQERRSLKSSERNHGRDIDGLIEIPNDDPSFDNNQTQLQCSSSESDDQTTWREQEAWCKEDVRAYLVSSFTDKENKQLIRWLSHEMSGKSIGDNEFGLKDEDLAPLLIVPQGDREARDKYWIKDSVVNTFFKLLKQRSDRFPKAYVNHYSFDSAVATCLIKGFRSEHEVLAWFKHEKLTGVHKLFLPVCLSAHWILFYVDTKEQKLSWLDSRTSSRMSYNVEKGTILRWLRCFLLPAFGYNNAHVWPFEVREDIPEQKNLVDCGLFVMKYADCLTHGDFFPFTQEDMPYFRHRTFLDIYRGRLHGPK